jgi:hypothetical protein
MAVSAALTEAHLTAGDEYLPSRDLLDAEAYLVSRGVRPVALVGHCPADPVIMLRVKSGLHKVLQAQLVIPFIFAEKDRPETAAFGYAAHRWCVDLLEWVMSAEVPPARKHEILGLLLGYSPSAIARHQESAGLWEYRTEDEDA